jgi:2-polyprenyl-3-methyl-5-hydroxy-6-metoxy-1,4-benzoquinol methylase
MSEIAMNIWNQVAPAWICHMQQRPEAALAREYLLLPSLLELIGEVKGRRVLDAGCGEGFLSRLLARQGASVTGIDISTMLLEEARRQEKEQPLNITYLQGSVTDLPDMGGFDTVVSSLVLPIIPD